MTTRPITPLPLANDILPNVPMTAPPAIIWVHPSQLRVDPGYQRDLSRKSVTLIEKIVKDFDWRRFKPPVIVRGEEEGSFDIIDGQHTAIAAASHGGIAEIPALLVEAEGITSRAKAFLGHNRDRVAMSAMQLHHSAAAAGDETAMTIEQVCARAGARVLKYPPGAAVFKVGDTLAIGVLKSLVNRRSAQKARIVLEVCVQAECAPITADQIRAVDEVLFGKDYAGEIDAAHLVTTVRRSVDYETHILEMAAAKRLPKWRALVVHLFQRTRKTRKAA
jgi:hypothetical protein